jgi:hypothetical protein
MTYSLDDRYVYVIPITALFQSLDVKELVTD